MKILLIQPPSDERTEADTYFEPIGIGYVGAVAREAGHRVEVMDLCSQEITANKLLDRYRGEPPDVVGFSCMMENFPHGLHLAGQFKRNFSSTIVFGGVYPSTFFDMIQREEIDYLVAGEGENTFCELLNHLENPKSGPPEQINGLVFQRDGQTVVAPPRERIRDLDSLPLPIREGLPIHRYRMRGFRRPLFRQKRMLSINTSRGCPYDCFFCSSPAHWSRLQIRRSTGSIIEELRHLIETYGITNVFFRDEDSISNRAAAIELCRALVQERFGVTWMAMGRSNEVNEELADWLARSGCEILLMGVETMDEEASREVGKPIDPKQVIQAVKLLHKRRIIALLCFIIGFPWDDRKSIIRSNRINRKIPLLFFAYTIATPFPSTRLWKQAVGEGLLEIEDPGKFNTHQAVMRTRHLSRKELTGLRRRMYAGHLLDPSYFLRSLVMSLRDPGYPLMVIGDLAFTLLNRLRSILRRRT